MGTAGALLEFAKKAFAREATYRMEVFTEIGSLVLRVYILAFALDGALRAKRRPAQSPAAQHDHLRDGGDADVADPRSRRHAADSREASRGNDRHRFDEADQRTVLLLQRRTRANGAARAARHPVAALRAAARAHRRPAAGDLRGLSAGLCSRLRRQLFRELSDELASHFGRSRRLPCS